MKENFEQSLLQTNEEIKKYKIAETDAERRDILQEIERMEKEYVHDDVWSQETSKEVVALQLKKHKVMEELHEKIQALEKGEAVFGFTEGKPRSVEWNKAGHRAMVALPSGKRAPATVGELVTDGEWGIAYLLEKDIPKDIKKRFVVAEARRKILALADEQIIETERVKTTTREGGITSPSYRNIHEDVYKNERTGIIAEKLIKTFFEKNILDHGLQMKLEAVDVQRDIDQKIDFIIHLPSKKRGVGTEVSGEREDVGIQLTTDVSPEAHQRKTRQIEKAKKQLSERDDDVDDIVLVTLPLKQLNMIVSEWRRDEMRPGGPIKRWNDPQKEQIFRGVLQGIFSEQEITGMWESILGDTPEFIRTKHEEETSIESEEKQAEEVNIEKKEEHNHEEFLHKQEKQNKKGLNLLSQSFHQKGDILSPQQIEIMTQDFLRDYKSNKLGSGPKPWLKKWIKENSKNKSI